MRSRYNEKLSTLVVSSRDIQDGILSELIRLLSLERGLTPNTDYCDEFIVFSY